MRTEDDGLVHNNQHYVGMIFFILGLFALPSLLFVWLSFIAHSLFVHVLFVHVLFAQLLFVHLSLLDRKSVV